MRKTHSRVGYEHTSYPGKKADKVIRHCQKCSRCWEHKISLTNRKKFSLSNFNWYENFPTYGKVKEVCPKCNTNYKKCLPRT